LNKLGAIIFVGDLKPRPKKFPKNILYRQGDLNHITKKELEEFNPEYFFHLAATFERSEESYEFWNENYEHNIKLSHHLMTNLKNCKLLKKIIFASSYLIYNPELYTSSQKPKKVTTLNELDSIYPRNTCGAAKLFHENEVKFLGSFTKTNFDSISVRIFRVYGKNSKDVISRWIRSLLKNEEITIYNKENHFDYIYAEDVAEGLIKLSQSKIKGVVNLGNGNSRSIEEVLQILKKHFPKMKTKFVNSKLPYEASQADMTKFEQQTCWKPIKQLEQNIPKIIEFESKKYHKNEKSIDFNILITSVSKKISMIKLIRIANKKLGNKGKIFGADINDKSIGKYFVDKFWKIPQYNKLSIEKIISYCIKNNIKCIIPSSDGELSFYAKYKNEFLKNDIHVMVSNLNNLTICLDKLKFYNKLKNSNFTGIKTSSEINEINQTFYVVKERFSSFGIQPNGIKLRKQEAINYAKKFKNPIFQPFVEGKELSIDLYVDKSKKTKGCVIRTREMIDNGESQITKSLENKELEKICSNIVEKLNLYGHIVMQVIIDSQNHFNILECNCRFGGASSLSLEVGLDTFYWFLLESIGEKLTEYPFIRSKSQKKQIRYPENLILF
jgi:carbamoyl-phosphate synthase large subunit